MPLEYDFRERMAMSSGIAECADVRSILLEQLPGAVNVHKSDRSNDKQGIDWWVELKTAQWLKVDAKVREKDWSLRGADDLALETWSVVESEIIGWSRDDTKKCDYVLWLWKESGRFCLVPFPMLCRVFSEHWVDWRERFKTCRQITKWGNGQYHSECVFVPRRELWVAIYKRYAGSVLEAA